MNSKSNETEVGHLQWYYSILFAIFATLLLVEVTIVVRAKFNKDIRFNRISFVNQYLAIAQVSATLVYFTPILIKPYSVAEDEFTPVWGFSFL